MNKIPFSVYDFFGYLSAGFLIIISFDYASGSADLLFKKHTVTFSFAVIVLAYTVGHIVAHLSSVLIEHLLTRKFLKLPQDHLLKSAPSATLVAKIFSGYSAPLPKDIQDRIGKKAKKHGMNPHSTAFFWHCHSVVKNEAVTLDRLNVFLNLYGFSRNMSMALLLSTFIFSAFIVLHLLGLKTLVNADKFMFYGTISFIASCLLYLRYLKFFRLYTQEVFLTYSELGNNGD